MAYKNIAVAEEIHARAKVKAAQVGRPLGRVVADLLVAWLEREKEGQDGNDGGDAQPVRDD